MVEVSKTMTEHSPPSFVPFSDDAAVCQFGGLSIENGTDTLALHGTVSITRDRAGLGRARALKQVVDRIVARLEAQDLPAAIAEKTTNTATTRNPFA